MEDDLLFTLIKKTDWKQYSQSGAFEPESLIEKGFIRCYQGDQVEKAANDNYIGIDELLLIVIDPLRIQVPIKREAENGITYPNLYGAFSIDAVIDRIPLKRSKKGKFSVQIKHFD